MAQEETRKYSGFAKVIVAFDKRLNAVEKWLSSAMLVGVVITILVGVVLRFVLKLPNKYGEEISRYLIIACVALGISIGVRERAHLGIDSIVNMLPGRAKKVVRFIADVISSFVYAMLTVFAFQFVSIIKGFGQNSPAMTFIPMYLVYSVLLVGFALSFLKSLLMLWNDYCPGGGVLKDSQPEQNLVN